MHAAYKHLPAPVASLQHRRTSSTTMMSRFSRVFFLFVLLTTCFLVFLQLIKTYNGLHNISIDKLRHYTPSTTSLTYHKPWTSLLQHLPGSASTQPRIGTVTVAHGPSLKAYNLALQTHLNYNNLHSYPTHLLSQPILPGLWTKESYLLEILLHELAKPDRSTRLSWLVWFDADTIIMNNRIPLETFLPPDDQEPKGFAHEIQMLYTRDWNGLNNGVFFLRVSQWSVEFLSAVLAFRTFKPDEELRFTEQSAMENVMRMKKFEKGVVEVPPMWFNSYEPDEGKKEKGEEDGFGYRRGQLLVHFAGVGDKEKEIGKWLGALERSKEEFEVEVGETNLGKQVEEFWRGVEEEWLQNGGGGKQKEGNDGGKKEETDKIVDDGRRPKLTNSKGKTKDVGQDSRRELWDGLVL
ncbi:unnamed protein product [Cercospora beticola]|nr:unnamed protein product [Cercospora beticola]